MAASASPAPISNRELKRQQKLAREQAEKVKVDGLESVDPENGSVLPVLGDDSATLPSTFELKKSPYIEPVQKRIRNYLKKKQKVDQLTEWQNNPEKYGGQLNNDQLEVLARKDQILAPLKELQNLAEQFTTIEADHNTSQKKDAGDAEKAKASAVSTARQEGVEDGKKVVSSLIAFLGYASYLRLNPTDDEHYNDANEKLLGIVYMGGDDSMDAAVSLQAASEDKIEGTDVSYKQIHDAIFRQTQAQSQTLEALEVNEDSHPSGAADSKGEELRGSNFVSLSDLAEKPSTIGSGGISFLNESEIEGAHMPESEGEPVQDLETSAPSQSLAGTEDQKNVEDVDWSRAIAKSSWADEESVDAPVETTEAIAEPDAEESENIQQPDLHTIDEFKTVEKKAPVREGRGRGRGHGRGRGERGGRGRGEFRGDRGKARGQARSEV